MRAIYLILVLITPFVGRAQNAATIARQYWNSVVMIVTQDANRQNLALGSGLIVENGKVVTNFHVIEGAKFAYALSANGSKYTIDGVSATDQKNDLAVLSVQGLQKSTVTLSRDSIQIGQRIYALGNPEGLSNSISEGIVSGRRSLSGSSLIQITAPISPGSSGGPIVDDKGQVVGIAVGAITSGQNLNFAIPVSLVVPLLAKSTVVPLNAPLRKPSRGSSTSNSVVTDGVNVVDVKFDCGYADDFNCRLKGLSIQNKLGSTIRRIRIVFILYSASGTPLDYVDMTLCKNSIEHASDITSAHDSGDDCTMVSPGLSKYFDFERFTRVEGCPRTFMKTESEKFVARILDFEIVKD